MRSDLYLRDEMIRSCYFQGLSKPISANRPDVAAYIGGFTIVGLGQEAVTILGDIFSFNYMGSAQFEDGSVPAALEFITLQAAEEALVVGEYRGVYYIAPTSYEAGVKAVLDQLIDDERSMGLSDSCGLARAIAGKGERVGWLEIKNGYFFFVDQEMFEKPKSFSGSHKKEKNVGRLLFGPLVTSLRWIISLGVLIILGLGISTWWQHNFVYKVDSFEWQRLIEVRQLKTFTLTNRTLPPNAVEISRQEVQAGVDREIVGYEKRTRQMTERYITRTQRVPCRSSYYGGIRGTVYCDEPIYATRTREEVYPQPIYRETPRIATQYTYEVKQWVPVTIKLAEGQDHNAYWPEINLGDDYQTGPLREEYHVIIKSGNGDAKMFFVPYDKWASLNPGQAVSFDELKADPRFYNQSRETPWMSPERSY